MPCPAARLVLLAWAVLTLVCAGVGVLVLRACRVPVTRAGDWYRAVWLGWVATLLVLQPWHLVLPIDDRARLLVVLLGVVGLLAAGWRPWAALARATVRHWPAVLAIAVVAGWLAMRALVGVRNGDSGLYHVPTIRWLLAHADVPGLANLLPNFAYHESYFLYVALLDWGPFAHGAHHLANGFLALLLAARGLVGLERLVRRTCTPVDVFFALCLPAAIDLGFDLNLTSPSPDFAVFVIGMVLTGALLELLHAPPDDGRFLTVVLLAAGAATLKLSIIALAATTGAVALLAALRAGLERPARTLATAAGIVLLAIVPWMARGIVLSGYPAYPSMLGGWPVDWRARLDAASVIRAQSSIPGSWALVLRQPRALLVSLDGLEWLQRDCLLPLGLAAVAGVAAIVLGLWHRRRRQVSLLLVVPVVAAIAFWLAAAPRLRFAGAAVWLLAIVCLLRLLGPAAFGAARRVRWLVAAGIVGLAALPFFDGEPAVPDLNDFQPSATAVLHDLDLPSGLRIHVPATDQCWDAPLPCAPPPDPGLRLRRPGDLAGGFVIDGSGR